jgi:VIT1/CCC1 family predicted Fe2+/Mn2+ transporter
MTTRHFNPHAEVHLSGRAAWLRAAVLGADDGIVSISSLTIGVAASSASQTAILLAGVAGLVAGAMSMAAGEYVSVCSQRDSELAAIETEKRELASAPHAELRELAAIYMNRGLDSDLALKVAKQLTAHNQLAAHVRDELGLDHASLSRPMQAAWISAAGFGSFALIPILSLLVAPAGIRIPVIGAVSLLSLAVLGALGGRLGGAPMARAALRVTFGGALAMAATAVIGRLFGVIAG